MLRHRPPDQHAEHPHERHRQQQRRKHPRRPAITILDPPRNGFDQSRNDVVQTFEHEAIISAAADV